MRRALPWAVAVLGVGLVVAGGAVFAAANRSGPGDLGWTAYAPLEPEVTQPHVSELVLSLDGATVLWTRGHVTGALLAGLGLLLLAGVTGWLLGRRPARRRTAETR